MNGLKLLGTGYALPTRVLDNDAMTAYVETSDEWITTRTGIRQRYFCGEGESTTTLAIEAARKALDDSGLDKSEIGCVIVATSSGEYVMPSTACLVHKALALREDIPVFDLGAACAGFLYAVDAARAMLLAHGGRAALVIGAEQMSQLLDMADRNTCVLFGDAAGAAVFALDEDAEYAYVCGTRGDMAIQVGGPRRTLPMTMEGQNVFRFAVSTIPATVEELLEKTGKTLDEVDWVVCHQANQRIIDASVRRLGVPAEKFYKNLDRYANTSAASIPLALAEMKESGKLKSGQRVILVGFGGGLTWAGVMLRV
ncbi:MAG: beta-ketoacyl-ACP synthase III [Candidatus Ventricola sp.]|nr:beta-ketoacyl-ACP synthase III [Candidatus Ventricola sp.]